MSCDYAPELQGAKKIDLENIKNKISKAIEIGSILHFYTEKEKKNLFKNISREVIKLILKNKLTEETLTETVEKYIKL